MHTKSFIAIALILVLALTFAACADGNPSVDGAAPGGTENGGTGDAPQTAEPETVPETGVYILSAQGTVQKDISEGEGFLINFSFSMYACQTDVQTPPGAGVYEGAAKLTTASDFDNSIAGMLDGVDIPGGVINLDMSSAALARLLAFDLHEDDSTTEALLSAYCEPIFDGGRQINMAASAGGYGTSQNYSDTGACPLPMTIEVFGDPADSVRPALITLFLCEGELVLQFEGTLRFVCWPGIGRYVDSDAFKAEIAIVLGE